MYRWVDVIVIRAAANSEAAGPPPLPDLVGEGGESAGSARAWLKDAWSRARLTEVEP